MLRTCLVLMMFSVLVVGCTPRQEPPPVPVAPSASDAAALKESILRTSPKARVGIVTTVLSDQPLAMVSEIDTAGLRMNDVVTIVDAQENAVTHGHIREVKADRIAVEFEDGLRGPMVGDVVVKY